jgi:signal transduction histidine kinase/DNA-binding response OmpR family regulator
MNTPLRVLIAEDSEDDALLVVRKLQQGGYAPTYERVDTPEAFSAALARQPWDVIIADYSMPAAWRLLKESGLDLPFIVVSGAIGEDVAVSAMKAGAHDYVMKDNLARLGPAVQRELQEAEARLARRQAEEALCDSKEHLERSYQMLNDKVAELEALHHISLAMSSTLDTDALLQFITKRAAMLVDAADCSVLLPDETAGALVFRAAADGVTGVRVPVDQAVVARRVLELGTPQIVHDVAADLDCHAGVAQEDGARSCSLLAVPLLVERTAIGVLVAVNKRQGRFTEQDSDLLMTLASHAAIAIQNARLYAEAKRELVARVRAGRLVQALNAAALAMEKALTPEEIFAVAAEALQHVGFSCAVFVADDSRNVLTPRFFSCGAEALVAAEKLIGFSPEHCSIPVAAVDVFRRSIGERKTVFVEDVVDTARHLLPEPLTGLAGQLVTILGATKAINAPLIVDDGVTGLLSVQSGDLIEGDMPAVTAFAHQMAAVWRKAELLQDLERSIDELKRTQAQFVQAQKMEALGTLAGGVAHDFNNLLTAVNGFAELVYSQLAPNDPRRRLVEKILTSGRHGAALVRQLLAFSRQEAARPIVLNLNSVITEALKLLGRVIGEDVELTTCLAPDLARVRADLGQVEQVLMNLAVNARDAMPGGGKLTIETANVVLDEGFTDGYHGVEPGQYVLLTVSDTGVGMGDSVLSHIFEPFFTTKPKGKGTGLGLATVHGIVGQHGGHIHVQSQPGHGTTFRIYLPVYQPTAGAKVQGAAEPQSVGVAPARGAETVLVVEDENSVREMVREALETCGYTVLSASSAQQAIDLFRSHRDDVALLISDVVLPDTTGPALHQSLAGEVPHLKVLFMSGYTGDTVSERGLLQDAPFLPKPFDLSALAARVRQVLDAGAGARQDTP